MPTPATFRDSTEILLPPDELEGLREIIQSRFTVSIRREGAAFRIIGSPVEIKRLANFLVQHGIALP